MAPHSGDVCPAHDAPDEELGATLAAEDFDAILEVFRMLLQWDIEERKQSGRGDGHET